MKLTEDQKLQLIQMGSHGYPVSKMALILGLTPEQEASFTIALRQKDNPAYRWYHQGKAKADLDIDNALLINIKNTGDPALLAEREHRRLAYLEEEENREGVEELYNEVDEALILPQEINNEST